MKTTTKSRIPPRLEDPKHVATLQARLEVKSKIEVVRGGLRDAYRSASRATRASLGQELAKLDHLASEGLDEL